MDCKVAFGNEDNTADALWSETMEHRINHSSSCFACNVEQESANLIWVVEVPTRTVIDLEHEVTAQAATHLGF